MKIELKRPIQLPAPDKRILRPGTHTIDDALAAHWFIQGMIKNGGIIVKNDAEKQKVLKPSSTTLGVKTVAKPLVLEVEAKPKAKQPPEPLVTKDPEKEILVEEVAPSEEVIKEETKDGIQVEEVIEEKAPVNTKVVRKPRKKKVKSLM